VLPVLCAFMMFVQSGGSAAGTFYNLNVTGMEAKNDGLLFVYLSANITSDPSCGQ